MTDPVPPTSTRTTSDRPTTQRTGSGETETLVRLAARTAKSLGATKLLIRRDLVGDPARLEEAREGLGIVWVAGRHGCRTTSPLDRTVSVPDLRLSRLGVIKVGLFLATLRQYVAFDENVVCLTGPGGSKRLDTVFVAEPRRDFPWLRPEDLRLGGGQRESDVLESVLQIALHVAAEGHEGTPVGTTFVIGDPEPLAPHVRQLILNPCEGHPKPARSVYNPEFLDTLRELSALDGAFVVDTRGTVVSAGTYLDSPTADVRIRPGLGARHTSAAAITGATSALAITVSESSGNVTVFHDGQIVLELEKPDPEPTRREGSPPGAARPSRIADGSPADARSRLAPPVRRPRATRPFTKS